MTCLPDCSRLLRNCAEFAPFAPAFPSFSHRHCCSRAQVHTGRQRTPRQGGLAAGQTNRERSTGSSLCPQASSSGWEGAFCPHKHLWKDTRIGSRGSSQLYCLVEAHIDPCLLASRSCCNLNRQPALLFSLNRSPFMATHVHAKMHVGEAQQYLAVTALVLVITLPSCLQRLSTLASKVSGCFTWTIIRASTFSQKLEFMLALNKCGESLPTMTT